jgi:hypothetical protein
MKIAAMYQASYLDRCAHVDELEAARTAEPPHAPRPHYECTQNETLAHHAVVVNGVGRHVFAPMVQRVTPVLRHPFANVLLLSVGVVSGDGAITGETSLVNPRAMTPTGTGAAGETSLAAPEPRGSVGETSLTVPRARNPAVW